MRVLLGLALVACQSSARVQLDVSALRHALTGVTLTSLTIEASGPDFRIDPIRMSVDADVVDITVPYGSARTVTVVGKAGAIVALFGRVTVDLPRNQPVVDLTIPAHLAGEIDADVVTSDGTPVPQGVLITGGFDPAPVHAGKARLIVPARQLDLGGAYAGYELLAPLRPSVGVGERQALTLWFGAPGSKCLTTSPEALRASDPQCRTLTIDVSGTAGSPFTLKAGVAYMNVPGDGSFVFPEGVAEGSTLALVFADLPMGMQCRAAPATTVVTGNTAVSVSCGFTVALSVAGLFAGQLGVSIGSDDLIFSGDGMFETQSVFPGGSVVNLDLTQPAGSAPLLPICTSSPGSIDAISASQRTMHIGCIQPLQKSGAGDIGAYVDAIGQPCSAPAAQRYDDCIHAGERRTTALTDLTSCNGVSAQDALDVLEWRCTDAAGGVSVESTRFKRGKGLADIIDWASCTAGASCAYLPNHLVITEPGGQRVTPSEAWWSTPIVATSVGAEFGAAGPTNTTPQVVAVLGGTGSTFASSTLAQALRTQDEARSVVIAPNKAWQLSVALNVAGRFNWLEGHILMVSPTGGNTLTFSGDHSRLHRLRLTMVQLSLGSSTAMRLDDLQIDCHPPGSKPIAMVLGGARHTIDGARINECPAGATLSGTAHRLHDLVIAAPTSAALQLAGSQHLVHGLRIYNGSNDGITFGAAAKDVVIVDAIIANQQGAAMVHGNPNDSYSHALLDLTLANNTQNGIAYRLASAPTGVWSATLANVAGVNNALASLEAQNTRALSVSGLAALDNTAAAITMTSDLQTTLYGSVLVTAPTGCANGAGGSSVLAAGTCTSSGVDGSSDWLNASTAILRVGLSTTNAFSAFAASESTNPVFAGQAQAATGVLTDTDAWTAFDNAYRTVGKKQAAHPSSSNRGTCGTDCAVFDWRLLSGGALTTVNPIPTSQDFIGHTWSGTTAGQCATFPGSIFTNGRCTTTYLRHARELFDDGIGNDNGLCETGEACLYTPHLGAWQGEGPLVPVTTDASVTLYQHSTLAL